VAQQNVEVVRAHIDAYRRQDVSLSLSFMDPHVILDTHRMDGSDAVHGHEGVDEIVTRYVGAFEDYSYEVERLTDLGSGTVLAVVTETGRGKASGVPVNRHYASLYTVIDDKIARITVFPSEEQALEAVGLRE